MYLVEYSLVLHLFITTAKTKQKHSKPIH